MKYMEPIILNTDYETIGIIDDYKSFIWSTRYNTCGDFELSVEVNDKNLYLLKPDYYIIREDDDNIGIIEEYEITTNENDEEILTVSGRFASSILYRRIIEQQTQINDTVSNAIQNLIIDNALSPVVKARKIANLKQNIISLTERLEGQYFGENLLETIESICQTYNLGFKTVFDENHNFVFELYQGIDRSYAQDINPHIIFSNKYENLRSANYKETYSEKVTDVLVGGEGDGDDRETLWVSKDNLTGLNRYEHYQDEKSVSSNDGYISDEEYFSQLKEEGMESMTGYTQAFNGVVDFSNIEYKKDIFMGDIAVVENTKWNKNINSRLIEIIESVDESGKYVITPTFGM